MKIFFCGKCDRFTDEPCSLENHKEDAASGTSEVALLNVLNGIWNVLIEIRSAIERVGDRT